MIPSSEIPGWPFKRFKLALAIAVQALLEHGDTETVAKIESIIEPSREPLSCPSASPARPSDGDAG